MTAENNGVPEDDDPFAYLYRAENGADGAEGGAAPTQPMPGVPRTSYQQATQVGRTQYGQPGYGQGQQNGYAQGQQGGYGQQQPGYGAQQGGYGQQTQQYGGVPHQAQPPAGGGRAASRQTGGGGSSRGVMIGAVAVVAAVAIGIGMALFNSGGGKSPSASGSSSSSSAGATDSSSASASASASAALPGPADAATAQLAGTTPMGDHPGAQAAGGKFVPLTGPGQSITWQVTVPADGSYVLWVHYANAGGDARTNVVVNGTATSYPIRFSNWSHESDWGKAWYSSYVNVTLKAGANTIGLADIPGQPGVNVDQMALNHSTTTRPWS